MGQTKFLETNMQELLIELTFSPLLVLTEETAEFVVSQYKMYGGESAQTHTT